MAKKKSEPNIIDDALRAAGFGDQDSYGDGDVTNIDDFVNDTIINDDVKNDKEPVDKTEGNTKDPLEDTTPIPEDVINDDDPSNQNVQNTSDGDTVDDLDDDDPNEAEQVTAFFDAFAEAMHWDVDDEEKPNTVQGIIDYMSNVVEENSKPTYSDPRIEKLDEYVRNGGSFDDFYSGLSQEIQYDSLDLENESNQKMAVREFLSIQGYTDEQINSKLERYEDADMLEDEAKDAVERLKNIKQQQIAAEQKAQQERYEQQRQQVIEFSNNLTNSISNLTDIRGVKVPKEDKAKLLDYITRTDENGLTQYQKDFNANLINNLIESAYFTMRGDSLISSAKKEGTTDAATKLRKMLRHSTKNRTSQGLDDNRRSAVDIASRLFG